MLLRLLWAKLIHNQPSFSVQHKMNQERYRDNVGKPEGVGEWDGAPYGSWKQSGSG